MVKNAPFSVRKSSSSFDFNLELFRAFWNLENVELERARAFFLI